MGVARSAATPTCNHMHSCKNAIQCTSDQSDESGLGMPVNRRLMNYIHVHCLGIGHYTAETERNERERVYW